ncbi:hypothetical protein GXW82_09635 [Streptacidiphilus sp. 4-A2]|nr:hypothetical protein [Streptacidiphilus sp. 4-A2]
MTGGLDGTVRLWDSVTAAPMPQPVEARPALPLALALADTQAGPVLAVVWSDQRLHLWSLATGRMTATPLPYRYQAAALTHDGLLLLAGADGSTAWGLALDRLR